jgi:hypothetical protein
MPHAVVLWHLKNSIATSLDIVYDYEYTRLTAEEHGRLNRWRCYKSNGMV